MLAERVLRFGVHVAGLQQRLQSGEKSQAVVTMRPTSPLGKQGALCCQVCVHPHRPATLQNSVQWASWRRGRRNLICSARLENNVSHLGGDASAGRQVAADEDQRIGRGKHRTTQHKREDQRVCGCCRAHPPNKPRSPDVEAGAPQRAAVLHACHFHAQLGSFDGRNIAARRRERQRRGREQRACSKAAGTTRPRQRRSCFLAPTIRRRLTRRGHLQVSQRPWCSASSEGWGGVAHPTGAWEAR